MVMNIIIAISFYPLILIMYFMLKSEAKHEGTLIYGITLDKELKTLFADDIERISLYYKKEMKTDFLIMALVPLVTFFIPYFSIPVLIWMIWLLVACFIFFIPYAHANKEIKLLKIQYRMQQNLDAGRQMTGSDNVAGTDNVVDTDNVAGTNNVAGADNSLHSEQLIDLTAIEKSRRVKWYHFILQLLISIACLVAGIYFDTGDDGRVAICLIGTFSACTLLFILVAIWMDRQKNEVISFHSDINLNYARAKKKLWKDFWVIASVINTVFLVIITVLFEAAPFINHESFSVSILLCLTIIETLLVVGISFWFYIRLSKIKAEYLSLSDESLAKDDDDNWLWGIIYYNKKNRHTIVEKRNGFGTTINVATPIGKGFSIACCGLLLSLPLICLWPVFLEFTPISLKVENQQLIASQIDTDYEIPLDDISNISLIEELPSSKKLVGTNMNHLLKGTFRVYNTGKCQLFLNPDNGYFIRFEVDGITYFMSGVDDKETLEIYEALQ